MKKECFKQFRTRLAHRGMLKLVLPMTMVLCVLHAVPGLAQDDGIAPTAHTISVADLPGSVPSQELCSTGRPNDKSKTFFLYNLATGKFLSPSGTWGTHASLKDVAFKLWLESNLKGGYDSFSLSTTLQKCDDKNAVHYIFCTLKNKANIFMDGNKSTEYQRLPEWYFEPVVSNSTPEEAHIYRIYAKSGSTKYYMTAYPNDADQNYVNSSTSINTKNPTTQYWKLISIDEYYTLFEKSPSEISHPTDATFLLMDPTFHVNNAFITAWKITNSNTTNFKFGGTKSWKYQNEGQYKNFDSYQVKDGAFFYAFTQNGYGGMIYQDVPVHQDGWYIFNCNGFSSSNTLDKTNASLYVVQLDKDSKEIDSTVVATRLNIISKEDADQIMSTNADAGRAFARDEYENQVMIHVSNSSKTNPVNLRFGIALQPRTAAPTDEWTAFNDFRMYYAGETNAPDLILDENDTDLSHLTETKDEYNEANLHLKRKFTLNKWNTLILPVSLTYGQMKNAFGDEVKVAKLWKQTATSVQFKMTECTNDNDTMLYAFEPYIIKPYKGQDIAPSYTATLTNADGSGTRTKTISADHYDIARITFDRKKLKQQVDIDGGTWITKFNGEGTTAKDEKGNLMTCFGTMAKTFDNNGVITGRPSMSGTYYMKNGEMWKVPTNKKFGQQAFRCWFSLSGKTDTQLTHYEKAKEVKLYLNGIEDNSTTDINDILFDDPFNTPSSYKPESNAIYNLNGQMVRQGTDTQGLPSGIYIVRGHKVIVR